MRYIALSPQCHFHCCRSDKANHNQLCFKQTAQAGWRCSRMGCQHAWIIPLICLQKWTDVCMSQAWLWITKYMHACFHGMACAGCTCARLVWKASISRRQQSCTSGLHSKEARTCKGENINCRGLQDLILVEALCFFLGTVAQWLSEQKCGCYWCTKAGFTSSVMHPLSKWNMAHVGVE